MPFGYLGTTPNQQLKNSGVFSVEEALQVQKDGEWGGSLQLIEEQTADGSSATVDFTSIKESKYDVHFLTYNNVGGTGADYDSIYIRLFEGGVIESASVYQRAVQRNRANGSTNEYKSTSASSMMMHYGGVSNGNYEKINAYAYFYNLGNSSKYSFMTNQSVCVPSASESNVFSMVFGGAVLPQTSVVDGIRIFNNQATGSSNIKTGSNFKLFGVKQI